MGGSWLCSGSMLPACGVISLSIPLRGRRCDFHYVYDTTGPEAFG